MPVVSPMLILFSKTEAGFRPEITIDDPELAS
jgi:hypothetical protein